MRLCGLMCVCVFKYLCDRECTFWPHVLALTSKKQKRQELELDYRWKVNREEKNFFLVDSESVQCAKPTDLSSFPYGCNTMWLCGAKVFQHNFITFQHLRVIVPPQGSDFSWGRNHSDHSGLKFADVTQAARFLPSVTFAAGVFGFDCDRTDPLEREETHVVDHGDCVGTAV